jgi:ATP-dependent Lon protease
MVSKDSIARRAFHPALELMCIDRWDIAFQVLHAMMPSVMGSTELRPVGTAILAGDRVATRDEILKVVDHLFALGTVAAGKLAMAWQMLTVDPALPHTFIHLMPQLQHALDTDEIMDDRSEEEMRARIRIWWRAAAGEFAASSSSMFAIAESEMNRRDPDVIDLNDGGEPPRRGMSINKALASVPRGPSLVVMSTVHGSKLNAHQADFKKIVDEPLPLVVASDVERIRSELYAEYPHATAAVGLVTRDLREGKPIALKPMLLVGSPGCGKSRLVRRLGQLLKLHVTRFDGAASTDTVSFTGTTKGWSNSEACVPARAVLHSLTANPVVMIDEIDKSSGAAAHNGRLFDALVSFLERETSARYRDQSLDWELDLSMLTYIATANTLDRLPDPLKDRFRIVRVPDPTLAHLPALAANVMVDIARDDEERDFDAPLAGDELAVIAKAWPKAGFSMRKLQKIVQATLEARDACAPRH